MKLTAVLLIVMLLVGGISCVTKDKAEIYLTDSNILAAVPAKQEITKQTPPPDKQKNSMPKAAKVESVEVKIKSSICEGLSADLGIVPPPVEDSISINSEDSIMPFMCILEIEAEYPGGTEGWRRFLNKNLKFIKDTSGKGITGEVVVQFVVDEEGNVTDVKAVKGLEPLCTEAVRVIKNSSKWTPGKLYSNGRHIKSYKVQPVVFRAE